MDALIDLVKQFQKSRDDAVRLELGDRIVVILSPDLHLYITRRAPKKLVDDILQEALIAIALGLDKFDGDTNERFYGFCYGVCFYEVVDALRRDGRINKHEFSSDELWNAVLESERKEPLTPEDRELLREVLDLLEEVRPPCVAYLEAHFVQGMTFEQVREEFDFPSADAARMKTRRCLLLARELMGV